MTKNNVNNERIKRKYLIFLKQAKGQNEATIDCVASAINRFEEYTKYKDFKVFNIDQAINFKTYLSKLKNAKTDKKLSIATLNGITKHLKSFIEWLSQETGYKSRIKYSDAEYFNLSEKEVRTAKASNKKPVATVEQIKHVLKLMPSDSPIQKRNRALIAFTLLTGARDSAIASMKIKHIDIEGQSIYQDAREVKTKFSKSFNTYFFPVGEDVQAIVKDWLHYLKNGLLFGNDDPIFPKTKIGQDHDNNFTSIGLLKENWSNAAPIRKIFKEAFLLAELPSFNPHSFRNTLVKLGESLCSSPEEFKAWSQNLGHEGVLTTFYCYGEVQDYRQSELIRKLSEPREKQSPNMEAVIEATVKKMMSNANE